MHFKPFVRVYCARMHIVFLLSWKGLLLLQEGTQTRIMKKLLILLCCITGMVFTGKAQLEYIHSAGVGYYYSPIDNYPALHYGPRINFMNLGYTGTLSIDSKLSFGYFAESGTYAEETYFTSFLPVSINFNTGNGATQFSAEPGGYYFGGGWAWNNGWEYYTNFGPYVNAGLRFDVGELPFDLNGGFMYDVTDSESSFLTISLSYMLNMYR